MGQLYLISVIGAVGGGHPDQGLPGIPPGYWGGVAPPYPDQGLPGVPPGPSQGPGFPTNPIAPGGQPPYPSQGPGFPTNPIAPGGRPPGIWGGPPLYPDQGLPGGQPGVTPHPAAANVPAKPSAPPSGGEGTYVLVMVAPGVARWAWVAGGGSVDNTLPGSQPGVDNTLPGGAPPVAGQPLPPTPQPKK